MGEVAAEDQPTVVDHGPSMTFGHFGLQAAYTTALHPLTVAKVLIQIGHEPMAPYPSRTFFGTPAVFYPNAIRYVLHIGRKEGIFGLYRGLGARLYSGVVAGVVSNHVSWHLGDKMGIKEKQEPPSDEDTLQGLKRVCLESTHETISRCAGTIVSHPLQVICIRSIAQFVGKEHVYSWKIFGFSSISEIYEQEGILGFFAGLVPRLVCEVLTIWAINYLTHLVDKYLIADNEHIPKGMRGFTGLVSAMFVSQFTYPFSVVSNCMIVNSTRLAAGNPPRMPHYDSWTQCYSELSSLGEVKRGSSMFYRPYHGPVILRHDGKPIPAPGTF